MEEELEFKVSSGLKNIIGRDLITDDFIAVFELVKNSYDANAKDVVIEFQDDKIVISDNGDGMSIDDLKNKWLFVAYSAKKQETGKNFRDKIQKRRHFAGAKGIGRFSADRLGEDLKMITKTIESNFAEQVIVNWRNFNDQTKLFESVKVPHKRLDKSDYLFPNNSPCGTILEISGIHGWDRAKIINLKHSLEKLINPFSDSTDFSIRIVSYGEIERDKNEKIERFKVNGLVKNAVLDILKIKTTQISVDITLDEIETTLTDRGTLIYKISEKNKEFDLIDDLKIDLYYLNTSAKNNFTRNMGIEPINFGSVFLFKNGFRVQPYGQTGDDSWGLDYRAQQGYARFLGTRNLFGRVEITTDDADEFKEVSSRDGGLVKTLGYYQLMNVFEEKGLKRLERYVVGVLWGEGFKRRNYFGQEKVAESYRRDLLKNDQESEDISVASSNLGSKVDFIQLIKSLSSDNEIKIIDFNKELVNLINEKLDDVQTKFISDLERIAEKLDNPELKNILNLTEKRYTQILKEKEEAQRKAEEEEAGRVKAEEKARKEEEARKRAEEKAQEEEQKRVAAEILTLKKEKERAEAELARIIAEQNEKEEKEKNKILTDKLGIETKKNQYLNATRRTLSDDAEQLVHSIDLYVGNASTHVNELMTSNLDNETKSKLYSVKSNIDKAIKVSQIIIKSNFDYKHISQRVNLPIYIKEYLEDIGLSRKNLEIRIENVFDRFFLVNPIDIDIVIDNLVSNSTKAKSSIILVDFRFVNGRTEITYSDNGIGVPQSLASNPNSIFELGVRESSERGSGIGMFDVRERIKNLKGTIEFLGNGIVLKGATFKITL